MIIRKNSKVNTDKILFNYQNVFFENLDSLHFTSRIAKGLIMSLVKKSMSTFSARIISFLFSIAINVLIARILGPAGKGM